MRNNLEVFAGQVAMVNELSKPGVTLQDEANPLKMHLNHMVLGLSGEVGELADAIKKYTIYNKELDTANVKEELGDLIFYMLGVSNSLGVCLFECMELNQEKLKKKRYKNGYTDQAAIDRADKIEHPNFNVTGTTTGRVSYDTPNITEVSKSPLQLEIGCYYESVQGKVYGPMYKEDGDDDANFPWTDEKHQRIKFWSDTGHRFNGDKQERLVRKVECP